MTRPPAHGTRDGATIRGLADAAMDVIDALDTGDLLAAVTPERLGQATGYAPSSIRYQLSRLQRDGSDTRDGGQQKRWAFDREHLLLFTLDALLERQLAAAERQAFVYLTALDEFERTGDPAAVARAVAEHLDALTPGATGDESDAAAERLWAVALVAADGSVEVARRLRRSQDGQIERYLPVHERALDLTGRMVRPGISLMTLARQTHVFIEGIATRRRFEPSVDASLTMSSVVAMFLGLTQPVGPAEATELDPVERLASLVTGRGRR
ncbi:MAG: hypothetical protein AAGC46_00385 [Solirubrobacteraceae bacterium]|nr:hypothetical protein [Patulibacter sp.]